MKHFVVNLSKAVLLVLLAALLGASEREAQPFSPTLSVHFLDVGEGDSIFIELPEHKAMLVDAGDSYLGLDITEYIQKAGYRKIDYLVATHPHADHIGSMSYIVRHMPVGDVYMPRVSEDSVPFRNLLSALKEQGLTVKEGKAGVNILHSGETSVDILAPESIDEEELNNCSLVLKLTCGRHRVLLTGDMEAKAMEVLDADLGADVLKVAHHGSADALSESLLRRIAPRVAVISCGAGNDYGHPHADTVRLLTRSGVKIYRTDADKTVIVTSDGKTLKVTAGNPSMERGN